jgi:glutathione-independent formaldehyde dehydrogenase
MMFAKCRVSQKSQPKLKTPTDALLRVTTSGICGSDLHIYDGRTPLEKGTVVGEPVQSIKKGTRVVLPFNIACGYCFDCHRGHTESCLVMNPVEAHAAQGYAGMGPYQGGQAEFVLVPHADFTCLKLPGKPGDQ